MDVFEEALDASPPAAIPQHLTIRADAAPGMGTGHVMRCLALARVAAARMPVRLVSRLPVPWLRETVRASGVACTELTDAVPERESPAALLAQCRHSDWPARSGWLALDGYHFGPDCHLAARAAGYNVLVIDDYRHLPDYHCDILLNQNIGADALAYPGDIGRKLLGPAYALLRPEFAKARIPAEANPVAERVRRVLLTLGGGDFAPHLERMAPEFASPELADCVLSVVGGLVPAERIRAALRQCPAAVDVLLRVDDMPDLLLRTDVCVTAGGSTCWELCCLGVPFLTISIADNQEGIVRKLAAENLAPAFSRQALRRMLTDADARRACRDAAMRLVDGNGAYRILSLLDGKGGY